jgi:hypothetical protein
MSWSLLLSLRTKSSPEASPKSVWDNESLQDEDVSRFPPKLAELTADWNVLEDWSLNLSPDDRRGSLKSAVKCYERRSITPQICFAFQYFWQFGFRSILFFITVAWKCFRAAHGANLTNKQTDCFRRRLRFSTMRRVASILFRRDRHLFAFLYPFCFLYPRHFFFRTFVIPWAANITEEDSCVFNEVLGMVIVAPISLVKSAVFCDVTPFSPVEVYWHLRGTYWLHLQSLRITQGRNQLDASRD